MPSGATSPSAGHGASLALEDSIVLAKCLCDFSSAANDDVAPFFARHVAYPHSVVTQHLIDEAGQPTIAARDEILDFFRSRLAPSVPA